ncbi:MAG: transaldolase [Nitrospinae bacterium]|nr:transaldolase [Nitrospinota bacterium]MZH04548.1 transaldolase [Nitrospinota bacterium]MZH15271.1 transaldolase [Nitrospinota bacterium]
MEIVDQKLDEVLHALAFEKIAGSAPKVESDPLLARLKSLGSEVWVDTGELEKAQDIWKQEMTALTTNNTLANQVVQSGVMDQVIEDTIRKIRDEGLELSEEELILEVGFVINCKIALRLVQAFKVKVSVELHPAVSRDIERTLHYGRRYFKVCPEFFIVKVPLTPEGYLAVRRLTQENIPINFTLGFSARQNYLAARLSNPDFVNVFLGRLNQVVIEHKAGSGDQVGEKVTLSTQNALIDARENHQDVQSRLIGASVRNGEQVAFLAGLDVLTIPPKAIKEFQESGKSANDVVSHLDEEIVPGIDENHKLAKRFPGLWELPEQFVSFVDALMNEDGLGEMKGKELVEFSRKHGMDLFHDFSDSELKQIYDHGKIPCLDNWPESIALDDLMTQSALQSFTKDQNALDDRIRSFLK